jgi:hypothetical protein
VVTSANGTGASLRFERALGVLGIERGALGLVNGLLVGVGSLLIG